jgi:nicotinamidase-related amidase
MSDWRHICVDMQRLFAEETPWHTPWMKLVLPPVEELVGRFADRTIFTLFTPPHDLSQTHGGWRKYYEKWPSMTLVRLDPQMTDVVPSLASFVPPARTFRKFTYSPWLDGKLNRILKAEGVSRVVITGGETDVCVLATVLGAVDLGYDTILLRDAVCSGVDHTHDACLTLLGDRFSQQIEIQSTEEFLRNT